MGERHLAMLIKPGERFARTQRLASDMCCGGGKFTDEGICAPALSRWGAEERSRAGEPEPVGAKGFGSGNVGCRVQVQQVARRSMGLVARHRSVPMGPCR